MPIKRQNNSLECTDYEAAFAHFQDINNRIERKTIAVFESASKLAAKNIAEQVGIKNTIDLKRNMQ